MMKKLLSILTSAILAGGVLTACGSVESGQSGSESRPDLSSDSEPGGQLTEKPGSEQPDPEKPPQITPLSAVCLSDDVTPEDVSEKQADEKFASSQLDFAAKLFKSCYDEKSCTLVSPTSVMLALSMTANGANGDTLEEMQNVLGSGMDIDELNEYLLSYAKMLNSSEKAKFVAANSIWIKNGFPVFDSFLQKNASYYGAPAYEAPFDSSTVNDINSWVNEHTDGMISKLINDIGPDTVMYLINAIVFDAKWDEPYSGHQIYDGEFTDINGNVSTVKMMTSTESSYFEDKTGGAKCFMKPYKGGEFYFMAMLPNEGVDIADYVESITGDSLKTMIEDLSITDKRVIATIPQFEFDFGLSLKGQLSAMGMPTAFSIEVADFSKMSDVPLYISDVIHKTHIEVNSDGTKAAAVTAVEMDTAGAIVIDSTYEITLDRPFVFAIVDGSTKLPVFMGTVLSVEQ